MELAGILEHCRHGDELAWEMLVRQHQGRVFGIAMTYVSDPDEARDLAQDIFVRVYRNIDGCREADRFLPWLIRIARNASIDHLRRRKARPPAQDIPADEAWSLAADGPSPEDTSEESSRRRLVAAALQKLSDINREIILLKDMQGMNLEDIAQMLELPLGTVKSRSSRARVELAEVVRDMMTPPGAEATA